MSYFIGNFPLQINHQLEYHSSYIFLLNASIRSTLQQDASLILLMCVLLFLSFVIAGSEVAFFSLSYKDIQVLKTKHNKALKRKIGRAHV